MKILFIGGTKFVGRKMVEDALAMKHEVSILHRGQTNINLFSNVKKYLGDRHQIQDALPADEKWDVVIDTCGYHPESVKISTEYLKAKTQLYIFISTISVYKDFSKPDLNENSDLLTISRAPPIDAKITGENYGPLKVLCEKQVAGVFGSDRCLILRPTIIVGAYDDTNRFDFWLKSIMTQTQIDVPDDSEAFIQFIDIRALSQFVLDAATKKLTGIYNLIGPCQPIKFLEFISTAKAILNPKLAINYLNDNSKNYPMYISKPTTKGIFQINGEKAYENGLKDISVEDTVKTTADYLKAYT